MVRAQMFAVLLIGSTFARAHAQAIAPSPGPQAAATATAGVSQNPIQPKGYSGPGTINVSGASDLCATATSIWGLGPFIGDNIGAGTDGPPSCISGSADVWYNWTAVATGVTTVSLCNGATNYDTVLLVYDGAGCLGTELACNDDSACGINGLFSQTTFPAVAGSIYKIRIGGFGGATGTHEMKFSLPPLTQPLGSNSCATPHFIAGPGRHPFNNTAATTGAEGQGEALCLAFGTMGINNDVWFTWTSPVGGPVTVDTCAQTTVDTKIAVYSGSGCPSAAALACNDDFCGLQSSLSFAATKGQAYTIQVGNFPGAAAGTGTFTITYANPATACSYDDGVSEISYTMSGNAGEELAWINRFGSPGTTSIVRSISAAYGGPAGGTASSPNGTPARLLIFDDPNNDGNPADAVLLRSVTIVTAGNNTNTYNTAALSPPVVVNGVYFVGTGIITPGAGQNNANLDRSVPSLGRAWAFGNVGGLVDYANVGGGNAIFVEMGTFGDPGVWMVRADCEDLLTAFCFPGNGGVVPCPCGNPPSGLGRGCDNFGAASGGASLAGSGLPSLGADSLVLTASGENNVPLTIFWTATTSIAPPGVGHAAGVRCVSGLKRLYSGVASGGSISRPGMGDPTVSARTAAVGFPISPGETRYYFTIYRDPGAAGPCGNASSTVNLSSALAAMWLP